MKASLDKSVLPTACACLLALATGCWTSDAHDHAIDASAPEASGLCSGVGQRLCFKPATLTSADGVLVDLSQGDSVTLNVSSPLQGIQGGFYPFPGPDRDAGIVNGINRVDTHTSDKTIYPHQGDPIYQYHLYGTVPASAGWTINWQFATYPPPLPTCPVNSTANALIDASDYNTAGVVIDASMYDGIAIVIGGNAGPPGYMDLMVDSVGTAEDPNRQQELAVRFTMPSTPTLMKFRWWEMTAKCGSMNDFNPARLVTLTGAFLALAGISYELDVVMGKVGFIPKGQ